MTPRAMDDLGAHHRNRTAGDAGNRVCLYRAHRALADGRAMRAAAALAAAGWMPTILDVERDYSRPPLEIVSGIRIKHMVMPSWFKRNRFKPWFLVKLLENVTRATLQLLRLPADAYHACDIDALLPCYLAAVLRHRPLVFETYEYPLVAPEVVRWRKLHAIASAMLRVVLPRCSGVITVSPPIAREVQRHYGGPPPLVIRNIPPYRVPVSSERLRQHLDLSSQVHIALFQGSLVASRGLELLVQAARHIGPNIVIVMLGNGPCEPELQAAITQYGVDNRVKLLNAVPYDQLLDWTSSADLGLNILPPDYTLNIKFCLPNKLFEYLMAGLPVLTSDLPAVVDLLDTYHVGRVVISLEPQAIGEAITAFLNDHEDLAIMRANALVATAHELRWDVEGQQLVKLYQYVLGAPTGSGQHGQDTSTLVDDREVPSGL